ncbi:hypothetical protein Cyrtocomes_00880 [Candidatus Cyrtobacter comes]|uniref:Uncharacterized protein n=1 Tax=Candidatus Cyrtobacter comes TaxID=675776 RepID=A0ABU5L8Q0_9RICK|nr:hypothetical protein [Candidatus Cyrtobacter comes]MDZ5762493.1 hypothetical protein [Candidatus Cyrtobacter comes]
MPIEFMFSQPIQTGLEVGPNLIGTLLSAPTGVFNGMDTIGLFEGLAKSLKGSWLSTQLGFLNLVGISGKPLGQSPLDIKAQPIIQGKIGGLVSHGKGRG